MVDLICPGLRETVRAYLDKHRLDTTSGAIVLGIRQEQLLHYEIELAMQHRKPMTQREIMLAEAAKHIERCKKAREARGLDDFAGVPGGFI